MCLTTHLRMAQAIQSVLARAAKERWFDQLDQLGVLTDRLERLSTLKRKLTLCRIRGYHAAAQRVAGQSELLVSQLASESETLRRSLPKGPTPVPSLRELVEELEQLEAEFGTLELNLHPLWVSVRTEPIELEGVYLGPFEIRLHVPDMAARADSCEIIALDPHPAASADHVTHPHVSDERLCAGDAGVAITEARRHGRLCDLFVLIRCVLNTYNAHSPYVALEDWHGESCSDCGSTIHEDDRYVCDACEEPFCCDCTDLCRVCETCVCAECSLTCPECDERVCRSCLSACQRCGRRLCLNCLDEELCSDCLSQEELEDENEEETPPEPPERPEVSQPGASAPRVVQPGAVQRLSA